ncbi:acyl-CoA thioesterase II [Novosphingobium marinum]|uniref:Acyl-CoA thioesterase-2 n=1 Tax=Novosphingobium marinum TaxID=1514948 RepID=A0A7Y9XU49_9SPHN|nr:acyl-CoA thioesterase domain-containing protein [Novosphingobium marinum]NYH94487.1 acyl-CoA thioesterase-2 [Novosphingobium marinum]GGC22701.1 acyl-CoA thioesterase II [Novosphingobium marinum]
MSRTEQMTAQRGANPYPDDPAVERRRAYDFEAVGTDRFRVEPWPSGLLRHYGGMVLSQCLAAAQETVSPEKSAHSLHAYFLKPGLVDEPLDIAVSRETDGRSFAMRQVRMTQGGKPVMNLMASFQIDEDSADYLPAGPTDLPEPEGLENIFDIVGRLGDDLVRRHRPFWLRRHPVDWRPVEPFDFRKVEKSERPRHYWFRFYEPPGGDLRINQRLLAYASDLHVLHAGMQPMGIAPGNDHLQPSSLDHAMWFHAPFVLDDWMIYRLEPVAASNSRALGRGSIFTREGRLVATTLQQGLARLLEEKRTASL